MTRFFTTLLIVFAAFSFSHAQFDEKKVEGEVRHVDSKSTTTLSDVVADDLNDAQPLSTYDLQKNQITMSSLIEASERPSILQRSSWQTPAWITGEAKALKTRTFRTNEEAALAYCDIQKSILPISSAAEDLTVLQINHSKNNELTHVKMQQKHLGIEVFGGEAFVHLKEGQPYSFNGRLFPIDHESIPNPMPRIEAETIIKNEFISDWKSDAINLKGYSVEQLDMKLQWYPIEKTKEVKLAFVATVYPDFVHRHFIAIDAIDGEIISTYSAMCYIAGHTHGAHTASAAHHHDNCQTTNESISSTEMATGREPASGQDLFGITRSFQVSRVGTRYYMIDASRDMFDAPSSTLPNDPIGALRTLDALNNSPFQGSFNYNHVSSTTNTWNDPTAVSAHYNVGEAYEYFLNTHGRNSINGQGGTVTSFIHVTDENDQAMDNAFWNGEAMFYGDGNQGFFSLARGLDVAGHEISHGVVQNSANLVYENEPGALNESFADVFGAMIDRDDWLIGEDVVRTSAFPTGALRNMQDPTQGLSNLNQSGYQPGHYSTRYTGTQDRGGVHINSGIPNRAFYLFATNIGKAKAEEIYYHALTNYLTRSSQFTDCRAAVMQSAKDLYGNTECEAAATAFSTVGIAGASCGGGSVDVPGDDLELVVNPGEDHIIFVDASTDRPQLINSQGNLMFDPLSSRTPLSKPSVSDNGTRILFINEQNNIHFINIDWTVPEVTDNRALTSDGAWRNVAISKDGSLAAATTLNPENTITVFQLSSGNGLIFPLSNPTTGGGATGDVVYSDAMEFDYTGRYVIYDALNEITGTSENIQYWDIGVLRAWDRNADDFGDGVISKVFAGLPENVSVGNPTLSKTKPNVLAYDYVVQGFFGDEYNLYASNIETNQTSVVFADNPEINYPNYSRTDSRLIFNANDSYDNKVIGQIGLADDLITPNTNANILLNNAYWGTWFANGERNLNVSTGDQQVLDNLVVGPNPASELIRIALEADGGSIQRVVLTTMDGKTVYINQNKNIPSELTLDINNFASGVYALQVITSEGMARTLVTISK